MRSERQLFRWPGPGRTRRLMLAGAVALAVAAVVGVVLLRPGDAEQLSPADGPIITVYPMPTVTVAAATKAPRNATVRTLPDLTNPTIGERTAYGEEDHSVTAYDLDTGAARWHTDVSPLTVLSVTELDGMVSVSGQIQQADDPGVRDASVLLDETSGRISARIDAETVGRVAGGSLVVAVNSGLRNRCNCQQLFGVDTATGQEVWTVQPDRRESFVGALSTTLSWIGYLGDDGHVRQLDPATGAVIRTFALPPALLPHGSLTARWRILSAHSSVLVAQDSDHRIVISSIDPTNGAVGWSTTVDLPPSPTSTGLIGSFECGRFVCVISSSAAVMVNPTTGHIAVLPGATSVDSSGSVFIAGYQTGQGATAHASLAFLDPTTLAPGPRVDNLEAVGFAGTTLVGLRRMPGAPPQSLDMQLPRPGLQVQLPSEPTTDALVMTVAADGTQTPVAQISSVVWCQTNVRHIVCSSGLLGPLRVIAIPGPG